MIISEKVMNVWICSNWSRWNVKESFMLHDTWRKAVHSVWYMFPPLCTRVLFVLWNMVTFKISWGGGIWSPKMDLYDGAFERLFGLGGGKLEQ